MNPIVLISFINTASIAVIAIVCALSIIKYHKECGLLVTLTLLTLLLSCVGLISDENSSTGIFALPAFRFLCALTSVFIYSRFRRFWSNYGVFILALQRTKQQSPTQAVLQFSNQPPAPPIPKHSHLK